MKKQGKVLDPVTEKSLLTEITEKFEKETNCYYSSARLWDDGIIMPSDTRKVLGKIMILKK